LLVPFRGFRGKLITTKPPQLPEGGVNNENCCSKDLPFAHERFYSSEGIKNVVTLSELRPDSRFAEDYGLMTTDGPYRE